LAKDDYDMATREYDEAIRLDPNYEPAHANRRIALSRKKNRDKPVESFKENLRRGLTPKRVSEFAGLADKTETYLPGEFIADFNLRVPRKGAAVARYVPFTVNKERVYRANLLFLHVGDGELRLEEWNIRSSD
jgi:hypothetical protein